MGSYLYKEKTEEEKLKDLIHDDGILTMIKFSSEKIASGSLDAKIILYNYKEGKLTPFNCLLGSYGGVSALLEYNDNKLISGDTYGNLYYWDIKELKLINTYKPHSWHIYKLVNINFNRVASCSYDRIINIYNVNDNFRIDVSLNSHSSNVFDMIFSNKNNILISGSNDNTMIFWDLSSKNDIKQVNKKEFESKITTIAEFCNGNIAVASSDMNITFFNNFSIINVLKTDHTESISKILELRNKDFITGSYDYTCNIYSKDYALKHCIKKHTFFVSSILQMDDGVIITGSEDSRIILHDENTYHILQRVFKE